MRPSLLRRLTSGLGSLVVLAALVVGVPLFLWRMVGWPLPRSVPSLDEIRHGLTQRRIDDDTLLKGIAFVGWLAWLQVAFSILLESGAWLRRRPARNFRFAGPIQLGGPQADRQRRASLVSTTNISQLAAAGSLPARPAAVVTQLVTVPTTVLAAPVDAIPFFSTVRRPHRPLPRRTSSYATTRSGASPNDTSVILCDGERSSTSHRHRQQPDGRTISRARPHLPRLEPRASRRRHRPRPSPGTDRRGHSATRPRTHPSASPRPRTDTDNDADLGGRWGRATGASGPYNSRRQRHSARHNRPTR